MNPKEVKENWIELIERLKQKFVFLTNDDLNFKECDKDVMFGELRIKLGKTQEDLYMIITAL